MHVTISKDDFIEYAQVMGISIINLSDDQVILDVDPKTMRSAPRAPVDPKFGFLTGGSLTPRENDSNALWTVRLGFPGERKIGVIKVVRSITHMGLAEAKGLVDTAPNDVIKAVDRETGERFVRELHEAGAAAELIPYR